MSVEKSTIDRLMVQPRRSRTPASRRSTTADLVAAIQPDAPPTSADAGAPATGLPVSPALRRLFAQLEQRSPALGGLLAERLWFRLPAAPTASVARGSDA